MDLVLGVSTTTTTVRVVLVEGAAADGRTGRIRTEMACGWPGSSFPFSSFCVPAFW